MWSLKNSEGWVLYEDPSGKSCFPVWPHPDFAISCAIGKWANAEPMKIDLDAWVNRWLPMTSDGILWPINGLVVEQLSPTRIRVVYPKSLKVHAAFVIDRAVIRNGITLSRFE